MLRVSWRMRKSMKGTRPQALIMRQIVSVWNFCFTHTYFRILFRCNVFLNRWPRLIEKRRLRSQIFVLGDEIVRWNCRARVFQVFIVLGYLFKRRKECLKIVLGIGLIDGMHVFRKHRVRSAANITDIAVHYCTVLCSAVYTIERYCKVLYLVRSIVF